MREYKAQRKLLVLDVIERGDDIVDIDESFSETTLLDLLNPLYENIVELWTKD